MRESMWIPGLILLIVGGIMSIIPFVCFVGIPLAIVGLVLLIVGLATSEAPATPMSFATPMKTCFSCGQIVAVQYMVCPFCGRPTAPTAPPQIVHGEPRAVQPNERFCPTCGKWYPQDYKLCPLDGSELKAGSTVPPAAPPATANCKNCGAPVATGSTFCASCGTKV